MQEDNKKSQSTELGVIIGRFQIDIPHQGHIEILNNVIDEHSKVIIFLGCSPDTGNPNDPLDFHTRKLMIDQYLLNNKQDRYNHIIILPLYDLLNNEDWSNQIDNNISNTYPFAKGATLYGGRDSFIKHYSGKYRCIEIESSVLTAGISATARRNEIPKQIQSSVEYRMGIITRSMQEWPRTDMCADLVVTDEERTEVILARKYDEKDIWRFIGGHFDTRLDTDTSMTARREGSEELGGVEISIKGYIGNYKINSWRKRSSPNVILTNFYEGQINFGNPKPSDDIYEIKYFNIEEVQEYYLDIINPEHQILWEGFYNYLTKLK